MTTNLTNYLKTNNITYLNNNNNYLIVPNTSSQIEYLQLNYKTTITNTNKQQTFIIEIEL